MLGNSDILICIAVGFIIGFIFSALILSCRKSYGTVIIMKKLENEKKPLMLLELSQDITELSKRKKVCFKVRDENRR